MALGILLGIAATVALVAVAYAVRVRWGRSAPVEEKPRPVVKWAKHQPDTEDDSARAIDPENPPRTVVYSPRMTSKMRHCTCHGEPLVVGERVVLWPIPDSKTAEAPLGRIDIFCERTLRKAAQ